MLNLDAIKLDIACPTCAFLNPIRFRDARLRDVLICRGCKDNIRLDDRMNECRKARRSFVAAIEELEQSLSGFNTTINIRL